MKLARGNMWDVVPELGPQDLFCVTTNATLRRDGALVMGRGIAKEAATRYPGLQQHAGRRIKDALYGRSERFYGLLILRPGELPGLDFHLGLFQVKWAWSDEADTHLIARSVRCLQTALTPPYPWAEGEVHLNFPGIGNGNLARARVLPLLTGLPDRVTVWEYAN